jgi:hypothetical protein
MMKTVVAALSAVVFGASAAPAAVLFAFEEVGGNVVGTLSGSLDLTGLFFTNTQFLGSGITPISAVAAIDGGGAQVSAFSGISGPSSFGSGGLALGDSSSGSAFRIDGSLGEVSVATTYASLTPLSGTLTFLGKSFASLGITAGTYVYTAPSDTITLRFVAAVPLPASVLLLAGALSGLGLMRRRKVRGN